MEHNAKIQTNSSGESPLTLRAREKNCTKHNLAVPRSNTGALAEKAKTCKG